MTSDGILANAERLISDARHLQINGRIRSAATLIVVALEQMGAFIEAVACEKHKKPVVHMGLFGENANRHAKRQDALASHITNFVTGQILLQLLIEEFAEKTGCLNPDQFKQWMLKAAFPKKFTDLQVQRMKGDPRNKTASTLMHLARQNSLKHLREYGFYENSKFQFSDAFTGEVIDLADEVLALLRQSKDSVLPITMEMAGVNMPKTVIFDEARFEGAVKQASLRQQSE